MKWNSFKYQPLVGQIPRSCEGMIHDWYDCVPEAMFLEMIWDNDKVYDTFYTCTECSLKLGSDYEALMMRFANRITVERVGNGEGRESGESPAIGGAPSQVESD